MTYPDVQDRPEPPIALDETATLLGSLERQRATFAWKTGALDAAGLNATVCASSMTLGGLVKHLSSVEEYKLSKMLLGKDMGPPWDTADWDADEDWDWNSAAEDSPEQLYALWHDAVARSRSIVAAALAEGGRVSDIQRRATQPAAPTDRPARGVRAPRRPRRRHPGVGGRPRR